MCTILFQIDKNFVKTDTVRNATHITRCSFLPPCIFLSSHLLFCRFTPFLLYQPKPLFILYSYKDVKSDKKEIQWWNFTIGWNIFWRNILILMHPCDFFWYLLSIQINNFRKKEASHEKSVVKRMRLQKLSKTIVNFLRVVFLGKVYWKNMDIYVRDICTWILV